MIIYTINTVCSMYHRDNLNNSEVNQHDHISLFLAANYCTYKGSHYEENDRWEDGCKVCVCVDGVSSCGLQTCQRVVCEEVRECACLHIQKHIPSQHVER